MYEIAYLARWETLPDAAAALCDHDIPKLESLLQSGLDINTPIQTSKCARLVPLEIFEG